MPVAELACFGEARLLPFCLEAGILWRFEPRLWGDAELGPSGPRPWPCPTRLLLINWVLLWVAKILPPIMPFDAAALVRKPPTPPLLAVLVWCRGEPPDMSSTRWFTFDECRFAPEKLSTGAVMFMSGRLLDTPLFPELDAACVCLPGALSLWVKLLE